MKKCYLLFLTICLYNLPLCAQPILGPTNHFFEVSLIGTSTSGLADADAFDSRLGYGVRLGYLLRKPLGALISLEAGAGLQGFQLRQRSDVLLGCNVPVALGGAGGRSDLFGESFVTTIAVPLGVVFHLRERNYGPYFKANVQLGYDIGVNNSATLVECGQGDGISIRSSDVNIARFTALPGIALGTYYSGNKGRNTYLELRLSSSLGNLISVTDVPPGNPVTMTNSGALLLEFTWAQQIGGRPQRMTEEKARNGLKLE